MQEEMLLRAWNAHRDYIATVRAGVDTASRERCAAALVGPSWLDRLLAWVGVHDGCASTRR